MDAELILTVILMHCGILMQILSDIPLRHIIRDHILEVRKRQMQ